ncbi:MAG: DUF2721 domain-containing protein, partial [Holophagaceae bacterium]|nr:DUF2721 domain-containing protein [Holophagaceae bacterium]
AIQLAVAPVFLLTGIATLISVLVNRLGRVIDRARLLEARHSPGEEGRADRGELKNLERRTQLTNRAITFAVLIALMVCGTIASLFVGAFFRVGVVPAAALFFVAALVGLIVALTSFLREVFLAVETLKFEVREDAG